MFDKDEVISDSEGEQDFELRPSTIDQFPATAIQPSPVSFFAPASTPAAHSIISSPYAADQFTAHLSPQAAAFNEAYGSLAERAKMRQRRPAAITQQSSIISETNSPVPNQAHMSSALDDLIVISSTDDESDDENAFIRSRAGKKHKSTSKPAARSKPSVATTPATGADRPASLPPIAHLAPTDTDDIDELDLLTPSAPAKPTKSSKNSPTATKSSKQPKQKPALDDERVKAPSSANEVKKKVKKVKGIEETTKVKESEKPAKASTSKAEELFKSREFIEDSDDDQLVLAAYPSTVTRPASVPNSKPTATPAPSKSPLIIDSDGGKQIVPVPGSTSRLSSSARVGAVYVELDPPQYLHRSSPTSASASDTLKSKKKRPSTGDDDDDTFDKDADPIPKPTTKKRKSTTATTTDNSVVPGAEPKKKRKSKKQEDDEDEYGAVPEASPPQPALPSNPKPALKEQPVDVKQASSDKSEKKRKSKKTAQSDELPSLNAPDVAAAAPTSSKKKRKSDAIAEDTDLSTESPPKKIRLDSTDQRETSEDLEVRHESPPAPPAKPTTPTPKAATTPHNTKVASTPSVATPLSSHSHSPYLRDAPGKENQSPAGMSALLHKMKLHAPSRLAGSSRRSSLSRIAPLHSQRKSPPTAPPPVPVPKKKSDVDVEADEEDWQAWIRDDGGGTVVIKKLWLRCSEGIEEWGEWTLMQKRAYVRAVKEGRGRG